MITRLMIRSLTAALFAVASVAPAIAADPPLVGALTNKMIGVPGGVVPLGSDGKVPSTFLPPGGSGGLQPGSNLADVADPAAARTNLGLAPATARATLGLAPVAGTGAYSDLTGKPAIPPAGLQPTSNLADVTNPAAARTNLGLAPVAGTGAYSDLTGSAGTGMVAPSGGLPRSLAARAGDVYNTLDFGAVADGTGAVIGTLYGAGLTPETLAAWPAPNGSHPFAWATNALAGLRFQVASSAAVTGSALVPFAEYDVDANGGTTWAASIVALWQDPRYGNLLFAPGLLVTLAPGNATTCATPPPPGTTIAAVGRDPFHAAGTIVYGDVQFSASITCPTGTLFQFEISSAALMNLTRDWLAAQAALAQATLGDKGGDVVAPVGTGAYVINHPVMNMQLSANASTVRFRGVGGTAFSCPTDLGRDMSCFKSANRDANGLSQAFYGDFSITGPGLAHTFGVRPDGMDGIEVGKGGHVDNVPGSGFVDLINGANDHFFLNNISSNNNGCGLYQSAYTRAIGNQSIMNSGLGGDYVATFCIDPTNSIDSSNLFATHAGFGPYVYYKMRNPPNVRQPDTGIVTSSKIDTVYTESVANYWVYDPDQRSSMLGNTIINGGGSGVGQRPDLQAPGVGVGFALLNEFSFNTMIGTDMGAYPHLPAGTALFQAANNCVFNEWVGDYDFVVRATATNGQFACVHSTSNTFSYGGVQGVIKQARGPVLAGQPVYDTGYGVLPYLDGKPLAGLAATPSNYPNTLAVYTSGDGIFLPDSQQPFALKADANQAINAGDPLIPTSTPAVGFTRGVNQLGAAGVADRASAAGSPITGINLNPISGMGATGLAATPVCTNGVFTFNGSGAGTCTPLSSFATSAATHYAAFDGTAVNPISTPAQAVFSPAGNILKVRVKYTIPPSWGSGGSTLWGDWGSNALSWALAINSNGTISADLSTNSPSAPGYDSSRGNGVQVINSTATVPGAAGTVVGIGYDYNPANGALAFYAQPMSTSAALSSVTWTAIDTGIATPGNVDPATAPLVIGAYGGTSGNLQSSAAGSAFWEGQMSSGPTLITNPVVNASSVTDAVGGFPYTVAASGVTLH